MSSTLELTEPAGPTFPASRQRTGRTVPSISACGTATFVCPSSARIVVLLRDIPSGAKIRARTNSSQLRPVTAGMTSPAARYMRFW